MGFLAVYKVRGSGLTNKTTVDVLEALAFFLNEKTGACFPSTESIAKIARVHPNVVRKTLKDLEDSGLISSSQKAGCKRFFTLYLERLPLSESTGGEEHTEVKEVEPLKEDEGVKEVEPLPLKKINPSPLSSLSTPLKEVKGEQGNNKEIKKKDNKEEAPKKRTRLTVEVLPNDWREYCEKNAPDIDPDKAFEDFKDYWQTRAKDPFSLDWKRTWQGNVRKLANGADWMTNHLKRHQPSKPSRYFQEKKQSERHYELW